MTFLNRGRPVFSRIGRPSEPAPEPATAATGLPVAAPAPEGGTDDLRASEPCIDGVPEELLDAALGVSWGMGFSHVRCQIAAVMPLHERMVREQIAAQIEAADADLNSEYERGLTEAARIARGDR